jgi:UDP-GlcNAc:undecaprenyl-phosphate GlcNAc-1-phosphate transferase
LVLTLFLVAATALFAALLFTPLARRAALAAGFVDKPGARKIHAREIAYGGGLAVAAALAVALGGLWLVQQQRPFLPPDADAGEYDSLYYVAGGAAGILILGLLDDRYRLTAGLKLVASWRLPRSPSREACASRPSSATTG